MVEYKVSSVLSNICQTIIASMIATALQAIQDSTYCCCVCATSNKSENSHILDSLCLLLLPCDTSGIQFNYVSSFPMLT